jgi:DNA-binding Lrp family transcriptional regulator
MPSDGAPLARTLLDVAIDDEPTTGRRRRRAALDAADVRLIDLLAIDGRMSNRALAAAVGMTEATVASRLRSMFDQRILDVSAILDWRAAGYRWDMRVLITVEGRPIHDVGRSVADLPEVFSVIVLLGTHDLVAHVLLPNEAEATRFLHEDLAAIPGVAHVETVVTLETLKYSTRFANKSAVPPQPSVVDFPDPVVDLDPLDHSVIGELLDDGRRSNREIARRLDVSEGTVRARLRRMEDAGLLRIRGQVDADRAGLVTAWAAVMIDLAGPLAHLAPAAIAALPEVVSLTVTAGRHDVYAFVIAPSRERLVRLVIHEIRKLPGVRAATTTQVIGTIDIRHQWVRFVGDE